LLNLVLMKIIPFRLPKNSSEAFRLQVDELPRLYDHLHQHPEIQITLILQSEGTLLAGDYIGRFVAGDVFVIGANLPHVFKNDPQYGKDGRVAKSISVYFDENALGHTFWSLPETQPLMDFLKTNNKAYQLTGNKALQAGKALEELTKLAGIKKLNAFINILSLFERKKEIRFLSGQFEQKALKSYDGDRLNRVLEFTFTAFMRPIQLKEAAAVANLSIEAFCKYFKTRTRKTYFSFLNELRVQQARKLLYESDDAITTIAYQAGFNNLSHFNRTFRELTGTTPTVYRRKNRGI
jgi:AraC-like DNA-binding protein